MIELEKLVAILSEHQGTIQLLITLAIIVERISEVIISYNEKWFKGFKYEEQLNSPLAKQITSIIVGLILVFSINIILIPNLEINIIINKIFAGLVISLGSNILHDVLKMLGEIKGILKVKKELNANKK